jgi:excisionase family DNA binding protein
VRDYLSTIQVAERLSTTPRTVKRYIERGKLKSRRVGGLRRIAVEDFEKFARGR